MSPGGVGYDINCGVRLVASSLTRANVLPRLRDDRQGHVLRACRPASVRIAVTCDCRGSDLDAVLQQGARWAVERGYGATSDLEYIEEGGALTGAEPALVSERARQRGQSQLGTLGSGNHFAELQYVAEIYDERGRRRLRPRGAIRSRS